MSNREFFEEQRFLQVEGCKIWPFAKDQDGYGVIQIDGKRIRLHRLACEDKWGPPPAPGMVARHGECRKPSCWSQDHVTWGTTKQNSMDRWRDGTDPTGARNGRSKLTDVQVAEIREEYVPGKIRYRDLAKMYEVSPTLIAFIIRQKNWKHVGGDKPPVWHQSGSNNPGSKLTDQAVQDIRSRWAAGGVTQSVLAQNHGVSRALISMVVNRKIWSHLPSES